jgi:hypothetical protein
MKSKLTAEEHRSMQGTNYCPNCTHSLLMCPCRVVPHGTAGYRVLSPQRYYEWRVARFQQKFGVTPEEARRKPGTPAQQRALRNLDRVQKQAVKAPNPAQGTPGGARVPIGPWQRHGGAKNGASSDPSGVGQPPKERKCR